MTKDEIIDMLSEQRDAALSRIAELEAAQPLREEAVQVLTRHAEARKWAARVSELEAELEQSGCVMRIPLRGELLALFRKHAAPTDEQREQRALATWTVCLWLCSAPVDEPRLLGMRMAAGEMEIDVEHVGARLLAASFRESLERLGAENYIELRLTSRTDPPLPMLVTIQRLDGKTPHELRREAEAQRDAAIAALERAEDKIYSMHSAARRTP